MSSATAVAARRSARHWLLSSRDFVRGEPPDDRCRAHLPSVDVTKLTYFDVKASDSFATAEIERARRYHRPLLPGAARRLDPAARGAGGVAFGPPGDWLWAATGGPWWARTLELTALVLAVSTLVRLPLSAWRGWAWERRWGFSTQSLAGLARGRGQGTGPGCCPDGPRPGRCSAGRRGPGRRGGRLVAAPARPCSRSCSPCSRRCSSSGSSTASGRCRTRSSRRACVSSRSAPACRCGRCSSPTRAAARASTTPTSRGSARRGGS